MPYGCSRGKDSLQPSLTLFVSTSRENEKLFSLDETNRLILQLELLMEKIQRLGSQVRHEMEQFVQSSRHCAHDITIPQLLQLKPELRPLFAELEQAAPRMYHY